MPRPICDAKLTSEISSSVHSCYLNPHSSESKHECVCGKRWMPPQSYDIVTAPDKKSP